MKGAEPEELAPEPELRLSPRPRYGPRNWRMIGRRRISSRTERDSYRVSQNNHSFLQSVIILGHPLHVCFFSQLTYVHEYFPDKEEDAGSSVV